MKVLAIQDFWSFKKVRTKYARSNPRKVKVFAVTRLLEPKKKGSKQYSANLKIYMDITSPSLLQTFVLPNKFEILKWRDRGWPLSFWTCPRTLLFKRGPLILSYPYRETNNFKNTQDGFSTPPWAEPTACKVQTAQLFRSPPRPGPLVGKISPSTSRCWEPLRRAGDFARIAENCKCIL